MPDIAVRDYSEDDEAAWLRCRVLAFLGTAYFDDVMTTKPRAGLVAELVAEADGCIAGVLDLALDGELATIDTIAVHPDHQRAALARPSSMPPSSVRPTPAHRPSTPGPVTTSRR
jgi:N-acetylglutamate synthase-like GNAT family acetyltransferase